MAFRNKQLVSFTQTVKKKAPLVKAIKAEFSQPLFVSEFDWLVDRPFYLPDIFLNLFLGPIT